MDYLFNVHILYNSVMVKGKIHIIIVTMNLTNNILLSLPQWIVHISSPPILSMLIHFNQPLCISSINPFFCNKLHLNKCYVHDSNNQYQHPSHHQSWLGRFHHFRDFHNFLPLTYGKSRFLKFCRTLICQSVLASAFFKVSPIGGIRSYIPSYYFYVI